jgi:hypothetical protein
METIEGQIIEERDIIDVTPEQPTKKNVKLVNKKV